MTWWFSLRTMRGIGCHYSQSWSIKITLGFLDYGAQPIMRSNWNWLREETEHFVESPSDWGLVFLIWIPPPICWFNYIWMGVSQAFDVFHKTHWVVYRFYFKAASETYCHLPNKHSVTNASKWVCIDYIVSCGLKFNLLSIIPLLLVPLKT